MTALATFLDSEEFHQFCMNYRAAGPQHAEHWFASIRNGVSVAAGVDLNDAYAEGRADEAEVRAPVESALLGALTSIALFDAHEPAGPAAEAARAAISLATNNGDTK